MDAAACVHVKSFRALAVLGNLLMRTVALLSIGTAASAADLLVNAPPAPPPPALWNWTGFYLGAHTGGALDLSNVSNPYGPALFGDNIRSPGPLLGGQIGYDWQTGPWVFGGQADITWANLDGAFTCLQPGGDRHGCKAASISRPTIYGRG
jgi:opacity protein-like surface antigen